MFGDKVSHGSGGLTISFLGTTRAAHSPFQLAVGPAVGLKGRGAQFVASRQVQDWDSGKAERWRRWGPRGRGQRVETRGRVPRVTQGGAPVAGRQARQAGGQCQEAGGPGHRQHPALLQQPQDVGGGEGFGR